ncbi:MAG: hypothetical protein ABI411_15330 [Tahibacter sp.]
MIPFVAAALLQSAAAGTGAQVAVCEFGEVYQGRPAECLLEFSNPGDAPLRVSDLKPVNAADTIDSTSFELPPHGQHQVRLQIGTEGESGIARHYVQFRSGDGATPQVAQAFGFVATIIDEAKPKLIMGLVDLHDPARKAQRIAFVSREAPNFRIVSIAKAPDYLDLHIAADGQSLEARIKNDAEWGMHRDSVKLAIESPQQSELSFNVEADVHGDIVPSSNPYSLDLMRKGNRNEFMIRIEDRSGAALKLGKLSLDNLSGTVAAVPCIPKARSCRDLKLVISDEQPLGSVKGRVLVELPTVKRTLPIDAWGIFVKPDVQVRNLNDELAKSAGKAPETEVSGGQSAAVGGQKIGDLVRKAIKTNNQDVPAGKGPLVRWQVANEGLIYGYHVYRADAENGPFARINVDTIKTLTEDDSGAAYTWRDSSAVSGKTYWYYVGTVYRTGKKEALSEPAKVVAK